jgi:hypothetical protein
MPAFIGARRLLMSTASSQMPSLDLNFLTGILDSRVTFTRASAGWAFNSSGVLTSHATNTPRFDYDPTTLLIKGLLIEAAATNLFLNSAVGVTQVCTVTAAAHTLSFYGTGTVTLSGVSSAGPLVGTGASNRVSLTFTPTAGSLTLTVSGSVTNVQLELGSTATSPIVTVGSTVTRAQDVPILSTLSPWFNAVEGSGFAEFMIPTVSPSLAHTLFSLDDATSNERITFRPNAGTLGVNVVDGGSAQTAPLTAGTVTSGVVTKAAFRYGLNDFALVKDGGAVSTDTAGTLPTVTRMTLGYRLTASDMLNGYLRRVKIYPAKLSDTALARSTA